MSYTLTYDFRSTEIERFLDDGCDIRIKRFPFLDTSIRELSSLRYRMKVNYTRVPTASKSKIRIKFYNMISPEYPELNFRIWDNLIIRDSFDAGRMVNHLNLFKMSSPNTGSIELVCNSKEDFEKRITREHLEDLDSKELKLTPEFVRKLLEHPDLETLELAVARAINDRRYERLPTPTGEPIETHEVSVEVLRLVSELFGDVPTIGEKVVNTNLLPV